MYSDDVPMYVYEILTNISEHYVKTHPSYPHIYTYVFLFINLMMPTLSYCMSTVPYIVSRGDIYSSIQEDSDCAMMAIGGSEV